MLQSLVRDSRTLHGRQHSCGVLSASRARLRSLFGNIERIGEAWLLFDLGLLIVYLLAGVAIIPFAMSLTIWHGTQHGVARLKAYRTGA